MPNGLIRVLLVEDDEDDYFLAKELFRELPKGAYHLDRVADFASALHAIDECEHDVYLVDYRLGSETGLDLIVEARKRGCSAPLIMLTGQTEREIDILAMQAGAVDYLVKDRLDAAALERSMRYALQQMRHEEAIRKVNQELEERVRERTAELASLNSALQAEIADRQRAEDALLEASRRKDEFLATLAHELRNPLAAISSALQLFTPPPAETAQATKLVQIMTRQVDQLVRLIDDLLDVSRISRGKLTLRRERFALEEALDAALDLSRPFLTAAGHKLEVRRPQSPLHVHADRVRLTQIVSNLLVNAAKYTPAGGRVELFAGEERGFAVIEVRDNGIGIPREMLPKIFELFAQVDSSKTRSHGGLGIGLTLVKTLTEMHGGTVEAASDGEQRGSRFTVRIPLSEPAPQLAAPAAATAIDPTRLPPLRVLVVDDNESAAYLLQRLLERLGQSVQSVYSAVDALQLIGEFKPQVIISDIGMPGMSGYDLARSVREQRIEPRPTLVALTGYGADADRLDAVRAGFDYHLCKPISVQTLTQILAIVAGNA